MNLQTSIRSALFISCLSLPVPAGAASLSVQVTDANAKPVEDAVVYAVPKDKDSIAAVAENPKAIIDQIHRQFVPLVSVVQTGTSITFPNKDNIHHEVYSFSPPKRFELHLYSGVSAKPVVFDKPGLVVLGCNIHDQMVAYVRVVDTPWFGKTDSAGNAAIRDLPPGSYEIRVWHYKLSNPDNEFARTLKINADSSLHAVLALDP